MFINTTAPELQNFDPTKSGQFELPPLGIYNEQFKVAALEEGQTKKGHGKLDITFEILTGSIAGFQFSLSYNVGHSNPDTAKWAIQDLMKIGYGATGNKNYGRDGGGFDTKDLYGKAFGATFTVAEGKTKKDDDTFFPQGRFTKIAPIEVPNTNQPQPAGNYNQQPAQNNNQQQPTQPAQPASAGWGQPA